MTGGEDMAKSRQQGRAKVKRALQGHCKRFYTRVGGDTASAEDRDEGEGDVCGQVVGQNPVQRKIRRPRSGSWLSQSSLF